jgi:hypothetical protein
MSVTLENTLEPPAGGDSPPQLGPSRSRSPTICLLTLSAIVDDPRVRRQGDIFHRNGWRVFGVGLAGGRSPLPEWTILAKDQASAGFAAAQDPDDRSKPAQGALQSLVAAMANYLLSKPRLRRLGSTRLRLLGRCALLFVRVRPELAEKIFWRNQSRRRVYELAGAVEADIWLANDWTALPIAARLAQE